MEHVHSIIVINNNLLNITIDGAIKLIEYNEQ